MVPLFSQNALSSRQLLDLYVIGQIQVISCLDETVSRRVRHVIRRQRYYIRYITYDTSKLVNKDWVVLLPCFTKFLYVKFIFPTHYINFHYIKWWSTDF